MTVFLYIATLFMTFVIAEAAHSFLIGKKLPIKSQLASDQLFSMYEMEKRKGSDVEAERFRRAAFEESANGY